MKRTRWMLAVAVLAALPSCEDQKRQVAIPPVPTPRYLSRDLTPETDPADATTEQTATRTPVPPSTKTGQSPDDVAREVREAVSRLQQRTIDGKPGPAPLGADEAPPVRRGEPPVKVSAHVPIEADQPIQRADAPDPASPAPDPGAVSLTKITPAEGTRVARAPDDGDIVPVPPDDPTAPTPRAKTPAPAMLPPKTGPQASPPVTLDALTKRYEELTARNPGDADLARTLRLIYFLAGEDEKSLEAIAALPPDQQTLWRGLIWTLINARDRIPGMTRAAQSAEILDALNDVRAVLQKQAPLELGEIRFCQTIDDFGNYTPLPVNRYRPGDQALLYTELRNFIATRGDDGLYRVRLNMVLSLEQPDGTSVWQETISDIEDLCRRPRQDFFLTTKIPLPRNIAPGKYILKATFEDAAARKQAGARLELEIVAPGR